MSAVLLFLLTARALGASPEESAQQREYERAAQSYLNGYLNVDSLTGDSFREGAAAIGSRELSKVPGLLRQALRSAALLMLVALACGLVSAASDTLVPNGLEPSRLAGAAAVCALSAADVNALVGLGGATLERMDAFSKILLPTVTAACAAAGNPTAAVARQSAALLFLSLLLTLSRRLVLPLIYAYIAVMAAHAALGNEGLKRIGDLLRRLAAALLSLLLTCFVLYLTVTGAVAGSADALAQKAAKTALSGMVPVVGGILSDAAETVAAGAAVLKGTVGVVGLLAVLAICLAPFLQLGVHYLVYKATAALTATAAPGAVTGLIDAIGSAFALVLGMVGGGGLILYVALITSIQAVSP